MLFNSYIFLFAFLPISLMAFYWLANKAAFTVALSVLVLFSLFFYAYWNPAYLVLLLVSIAINYTFGLLLHKSQSKNLLIIGIAANLALIAYYKYAGFFVQSINDISGSNYTFEALILPLGISFFTFQQITFLVDTYKGEAERYSFLNYCQFVTFFPQLIAGPIVHHHEMMPQFNKPNILANVNINISIGLSIFLLGLFKKVILADSIAVFATPVFDSAEAGVTLTLYEAWVGALAYTFQLYFDFSGYSDMAVGLARMFGVTLPVNFNSPYKATSIIDFWRRWHITLSRFLRNYLYIPLGGNRYGNTRRSIHVFITMLLGGLWHGAGWTFIIWGALHGVYLLINHLWRSLFPPKARTWFPITLLCHLLTLFAVVVAWVVFRAESWAAAQSLLYSMFGFNGIALPPQLIVLQDKFPELVSSLDISFGSLFYNQLFSISSAIGWIAALALVSWFAPNTQEIMKNYQPILGTIRDQRLRFSPNWLWLVILSLIGAYTLLHLSGVSEFLYFQF